MRPARNRAGPLDADGPGPRTPAAALRLLAVDLETTGLDPARDEILAMGWVPVDGGSIDLSGARGRMIRPTGPVGQSATVHGLTDDALAGAVPLAEALTELLTTLRGRVLLAHHAPVETGFLTAACRAVLGGSPRWRVIDTVRLQRRVLGGRWHAPEPEELRLAAARAHLGLPRYRAHDALTDALACAELYLAQVARLAGDRALTLRSLSR